MLNGGLDLLRSALPRPAAGSVSSHPRTRVRVLSNSTEDCVVGATCDPPTLAATTTSTSSASSINDGFVRGRPDAQSKTGTQGLNLNGSAFHRVTRYHEQNNYTHPLSHSRTRIHRRVVTRASLERPLSGA